MKRSLFLILTITLVSIGLWQTGQGLWIYLKADLSQFLLELAWLETLRGKQEVKPWPWADTWPIGKLSVPKHEVELIVLANSNGRTLAFGPGQESISAPLGENGTTILSGHRDTHFRFLEWLNEGDQITLQQPNRMITFYVIQAIDIVDAHRFSIQLNHTQKYLVLVTCYPFDALSPGGSQRYVVTAVAHQPDRGYKDFPI